MSSGPSIVVSHLVLWVNLDRYLLVLVAPSLKILVHYGTASIVRSKVCMPLPAATYSHGS